MKGLRPKVGRCWREEEFLDAWGYHRLGKLHESIVTLSSSWVMDIFIMMRYDFGNFTKVDDSYVNISVVKTRRRCLCFFQAFVLVYYL